MIKQEIFNDSAISLANYVTDENHEWKNFEKFLKNGGNPFHHIIFDVCVILDLIETDFFDAVIIYSTDEYRKQVEDFIVNQMGE
jgi:hypothetical protein